MGGGSHCDYKNISFLFKSGAVFRLDGLCLRSFSGYREGWFVCLY